MPAYLALYESFYNPLLYQYLCIQDIWYISRHRSTQPIYPVLLHSSFLVAGFDLLSFFRQSFQQFLSDIIPPFTPIHSLAIKKELTHHNNRQHYTYYCKLLSVYYEHLALKVLHGCVNNMLQRESSTQETFRAWMTAHVQSIIRGVQWALGVKDSNMKMEFDTQRHLALCQAN